MIEPQYEDQTRYTAPPDPQPDERRYATCEILAYLESWIPGYTADSYTIDEVRQILATASAAITDEDHGIDTV